MSDLADTLESRVEYDADTGTYYAFYDWTEEEPTSTAVTLVVSHVLDIEPTAIESIDTTIDPDALDRIFHPDWTTRTRDDGAHLTFTIEDCQVTVYRGGTIVVNPPEQFQH